MAAQPYAPLEMSQRFARQTAVSPALWGNSHQEALRCVNHAQLAVTMTAAVLARLQSASPAQQGQAPSLQGNRRQTHASRAQPGGMRQLAHQHAAPAHQVCIQIAPQATPHALLAQLAQQQMLLKELLRVLHATQVSSQRRVLKHVARAWLVSIQIAPQATPHVPLAQLAQQQMLLKELLRVQYAP